MYAVVELIPPPRPFVIPTSVIKDCAFTMSRAGRYRIMARLNDAHIPRPMTRAEIPRITVNSPLSLVWHHAAGFPVFTFHESLRTMRIAMRFVFFVAPKSFGLTYRES